MFAGYLFLRFKDGREIRQINPSQTLMNLQYQTLKLVLVLLRSGLYSEVVLSLRCLESEVLLLNAVMRPKIIIANTLH